MKREFIITEDGSISIHLPDWNEQYHSKHGAIAEAVHVFIEAGLHHFMNSHKMMEFSVLEIGFGTGLNAFLTCLQAEEKNLQIHYTGVEAYPVTASEITELNYAKLLDASEESFVKLHSTPWGTPSEVNPFFTLLKQQKFFSEITEIEAYHLIYFDAFGARVQPELWTEEIFTMMFDALKSKGVLVTYAAKGSVRRAMQAVGFSVERLPGPPGKREMLRATKK